MGAGKPGLQRPGNDRRFPPPGVKDVASYGWTTYKRGAAHVGGARGGASLQQPQRSTLRGRTPRRCGPGCARKPALEAGWHGFPKSFAVKSSAAPRHGVPASHGASWRRTGGGGSGGSDPPLLSAGAARDEVNRRTQWRTINTRLGGVAPSTVIPAGRPSGWLKPRNFSLRYCQLPAASVHMTAPSFRSLCTIRLPTGGR